MKKHISVIIPCYNCSSTIVDTLKNLENQTLAPDEVICVDDGSTDSTLNTIESFSKKSTLNIRLLKKENTGVSDSRNYGIKESTSELLFFLDSDDLFSKNFIEHASALISQGFDFVFGCYTRDLNKIKICSKSIEMSKIKAQQLFMIGNKKVHSSCACYKKSIISGNHILYTSGARYGEDWEFTTKYMDCCHKIAFINDQVMFYRLSDSSVLQTATFNQTDAIFSAERAEAFLKQRNSDFYNDFHNYMKHKAIFSVLHTFAKFREQKLYLKTLSEFNTKKSMEKLFFYLKTPFKIKIAALVFLISPKLFYFTIGRF